MTTERTVAFFDFDGTLTTTDSLMPFLRFMAGDLRYYMKLALVSPFLVGYLTKTIKNDIAKQAVLKRYLGNIPEEKIREIGVRFATERIGSILNSVGMERLRWHQNQGHECVIVSASLDIYLQHWGTMQGFNHVICSSLETDTAGKATGKLKGQNCFAEEKVRRIQEWYGETRPTQIFAYGDSAQDMPMLHFADKSWLIKDGKLNQVK